MCQHPSDHFIILGRSPAPLLQKALMHSLWPRRCKSNTWPQISSSCTVQCVRRGEVAAMWAWDMTEGMKVWKRRGGEERKDIGIDLSAVLLVSIGYKYSCDPTYIQFLYNLIHSSTIWLVFHQHKDNNGEYKFLYVTFQSAFCPSALMRMSRCRSDVLNQIKQSRVITNSEQVKWLALVKQLHIRKRSYCGNVDAFLTEATEVKWRFKPKCFPEPNQVFFLSKPNQTATVRHSSQPRCFLGYVQHFRRCFSK